ncbi:STAS domain-containing protein [Myxococcaceae bacterium GXIMD 01537]
MKISTRNVEGVEVLQLDGKLTLGVGDVALRDAVRQAMEAGKNNILLDMTKVTTIDSAGIGELVSSYAGATSRNARLKLLGLTPKVNDILHITQLITVFEVHDVEAEAIASFS